VFIVHWSVWLSVLLVASRLDHSVAGQVGAVCTWPSVRSRTEPCCPCSFPLQCVSVLSAQEGCVVFVLGSTTKRCPGTVRSLRAVLAQAAVPLCRSESTQPALAVGPGASCTQSVGWGRSSGAVSLCSWNGRIFRPIFQSISLGMIFYFAYNLVI
jgi:hypothetical protein